VGESTERLPTPGYCRESMSSLFGMSSGWWDGKKRRVQAGQVDKLLNFGANCRLSEESYLNRNTDEAVLSSGSGSSSTQTSRIGPGIQLPPKFRISACVKDLEPILGPNTKDSHGTFTPSIFHRNRLDWKSLRSGIRLPTLTTNVHAD
jgi:hypothetical protein